MRIYIQENNTLLKFNLPSKVDGSLLFSFKSGFFCYVSTRETI